MTSASEPGPPELPFPLFRISSDVEHYFLYDINTITWLRKNHHVLGVLIGTLPQIPQQNVFLGLPLELMPEEARLLTEKELAYIVDDLSWHKKGLQTSNHQQRIDYLKNLAREGRAANQTSKSKKLDRTVKAIKAGKANKKSPSPALEKNERAHWPSTGESSARDPADPKYAIGQAAWAEFSAKSVEAEAERRNRAAAFMEQKRAGAKEGLALPAIQETWRPVKVADDGRRKVQHAISSTSSDENLQGSRPRPEDEVLSASPELVPGAKEGELVDTSALATPEEAPEARGGKSNLEDLSGLFFSPTPEPKSTTLAAMDGDLLSSDLEAWATTPTTSYPPLVPPPPKPTLPPPTVKPSSYALYKHLHEKGYYMSPGLRFGCEYLVYPGDPLRFHSHFLGIGADWDEEIDLIDLVGGGRLGTGVKKGWLIGGVEETDQPLPNGESGQQPKDATEDGEGKVRTFCVEWSGM
ncbi:MAG: tRNA-splicing endonuclease subunit [Icmadophila ericetorum]|nr:tRNA-splicing endonuclease subunit [Icmadophila ericetorum]